MATLQDLLDRQELADLVARYSRAVDRRAFSILEDLYHPEAVHDHGPMFQGGRDDFIAWIRCSPEDLITQHVVGNALYWIEGDRAEGDVQHRAEVAGNVGVREPPARGEVEPPRRRFGVEGHQAHSRRGLTGPETDVEVRDG